jgi:hypothetical protein
VTIHSGKRLSTIRFDHLTRPQLLAAVSAAAVGISAFLPWWSEMGLGRAGIAGEGKLTLLCALAGLRRLTRTAYLAGSAPAAGLVLLTALDHMNDLAGLGVYLTLIAVVGWIVALIWDVNEHGKHSVY